MAIVNLAGGKGEQVTIDGNKVRRKMSLTSKAILGLPGKYGTTTSQWGSVSTLPYNFARGSAVVYNGELHILGSSVSGNYTKHYKWNGSSWAEVSTLPYNFYYGSAVVYKDEIHILGGNYSSSSSSNMSKNHYKWNGSSWEEVSTLPYNFASGSAVVHEDEIHVLGSTVSSYRARHYKWNGSAWTALSSIPYDFSCGVAVNYNEDIYIIGGNTSDSTIYRAKYHYKWDSDYDVWGSVTQYAVYIQRGSGVVCNDEINVLGGDDEVNSTTVNASLTHYRYALSNLGTMYTEQQSS